MSSPLEYRAGGIVYRRAQMDDDDNLRALLRDNAMKGWVSMALEREPSYFAGENVMGDTATVIAYPEEKATTPVGMYNCAFMAMHVNGIAANVGYLGGLRVSSPYRNRLRVVRQGYDSIPLLMGDYKPEMWMTSIAADNQAALRLLEAGLKGMPHYQPLAELETLAISTQHGQASSVLRPATTADIPALVSFYNRHASNYHFAPVLDEVWLKQLNGRHGLLLSDFYLLEDGGELTGCLALWDQRSYKQVVAYGYKFPMNVLRRPYNLWARYARRLVLPSPGNALQSLYFAFAVFPKDQTLALIMLRDALYKARQKKLDSAVLGMSSGHPLHALLVKTFKPHVYRTRIERVSWPQDELINLDDRPVQPEVALL